MTNIDIKENNLYHLDSRLLEILLTDRTTKKILFGQRITMLQEASGINSVIK